MNSVDQFVVYFGDFNRHIDQYIDAFDGIHRWIGVDQRNYE